MHLTHLFVRWPEKVMFFYPVTPRNKIHPYVFNTLDMWAFLCKNHLLARNGPRTFHFKPERTETISQKHQKHGKIHVGIQAKYTSECPLYNSQRTPVTGPVTNVWAFVLSKPFSVTPARCPVIPFNSDTNGTWSWHHRLRGQSHKTSPLQFQVPRCHLHFWQTSYKSVPTTPSSSSIN